MGGGGWRVRRASSVIGICCLLDGLDGLDGLMALRFLRLRVLRVGWLS